MIADHSLNLFYAMRIAVLSLGAFTIGFAIYVGIIYARGGLHSEVYGRGRHVMFIAISYCLLAGELIFEIGQRAVNAQPITWRLPVAVVAFGLGTYALYKLLGTRAEQSREGKP